jgi:hypothetical protein
MHDKLDICCGGTALKLYSDDAELHAHSVLEKGCISLQHSLDRLAQWAEKLQLTINMNKRSVLCASVDAMSIF